MSLVRSAELVATPYENAKIYSLKGTDAKPRLSSQISDPGKQRSMYMTDSCSSESYGKYFQDSPSEERIKPSSSGVSTNSFRPDDASSYQPMASLRASMGANNPFDTSVMSTRRHDAYYQPGFGSDFSENESLYALDFNGQRH